MSAMFSSDLLVPFLLPLRNALDVGGGILDSIQSQKPDTDESVLMMCEVWYAEDEADLDEQECATILEWLGDDDGAR